MRDGFTLPKNIRKWQGTSSKFSRQFKSSEDMAPIDIREIINLTPQLLSIPFKHIWYSYDEEADVLYLSFKKPSRADESELTDDDIIIRYEKGEVIGITVLHASKRKTAS